MIVYRFCHKQYASDLSGTGARLYGGRWNDKGLPALYTSQHISLGLLEVLVNAHSLEALQELSLMQLSIPAKQAGNVYKVANLKAGWHLDFDYSKWIGSEFLRKGEHLILECPSAVVFCEKNYMLNPAHRDFDKIEMLPVDNFAFDKRLFK